MALVKSVRVIGAGFDPGASRPVGVDVVAVGRAVAAVFVDAAALAAARVVVGARDSSGESAGVGRGGVRVGAAALVGPVLLCRAGGITAAAGDRPASIGSALTSPIRILSRPRGNRY